MPAKPDVCAVIVTRNRRELLAECLAAVSRQTHKADRTIVIDNASTDGTPEYVRANHPDVDLVTLRANTGGGGGFHLGVKKSYEAGFGFSWLMDDDTIPRPDCLEKLLEAVSETADAGFVCSRVVDPQGRSTNVPIPDYRRGETLNPEWEKFLDRGLVKVRQCTFVSVLVPRETVALVGFPVAEMFIWGDDIEYTYRITDHRPGYLAGRSVAVHKRVNPAPPRIFRETDRARIRLHYYNFRNQTYLIKRFRARREKFFTAWALLANCLRSLASPPHRFLKFSTALRGIVAGLFFRPDPTGGFKKP